jgi:cytochrome c-type biogenesis protein CcmH/NrfG
VLLGWTRFLADPDGAAGLAEADLQEALRGDPKCGDAWLYRGRIAARQGDVAAARKHFEAARKAEPDHVEAGRELRLMDMRGKGPKDAAASGAVAPGSPKSAGLQGLLSRLRKPL